MARNNITKLHWHERFLKEKQEYQHRKKRLLVDYENFFLQKNNKFNMFFIQTQ